MKRLIIDDERTFPRLSDCVYARSSAEGLEHLQEGSFWDEVWLDHDLGGEDTTRPIVLHLAESAYNGHPLATRVVVHTMNPVGRKYIVTSLRRFYPIVEVAVEDYIYG